LNTVWKYNLTDASADGFVDVPEGAEVLHVEKYGSELLMWARVDSDAPKRPRRFRVVGTGAEAPTWMRHEATVFDRPFIWHVFVEPYSQPFVRQVDGRTKATAWGSGKSTPVEGARASPAARAHPGDG